MIGQVVGNYRLVQKVGEGGMGVVYEALREDIGIRAAIKVLHRELALNPEMATRFFNEIQVTNFRR
jgi:serine/threonine protein kinase